MTKCSVKECEVFIDGIKFCRGIKTRKELKKSQKRKLKEFTIQTHQNLLENQTN